MADGGNQRQETADGTMPEELGWFERELADSLRDDDLRLILLPTEQCNFRCTYCYETFALGRMASQVIGGIKQLIERRVGQLTSLSISWFGGEPLLALPLIEDISTHILHLTEHNSHAPHYLGTMTTNGYLLDGSTAERLADLGIRKYQITLDGPRHLHDRARVRADGRGSYDRIWSNLLSIQAGKAPVEILLRVHLTRANLYAMPDFIQRVRDSLLGDQRFSINIRPVVRMGGASDILPDILDDTEDARISEPESLVLEQAGPQQVFAPSHTCYAARANCFLVRADGRIGKCTVALEDPANSLGRLLPDGTLQIDSDRLRPWLKG